MSMKDRGFAGGLVGLLMGESRGSQWEGLLWNVIVFLLLLAAWLYFRNDVYGYFMGNQNQVSGPRYGPGLGGKNY
jgi:hypothetical protein